MEIEMHIILWKLFAIHQAGITDNATHTRLTPRYQG